MMEEDSHPRKHQNQGNSKQRNLFGLMRRHKSMPSLLSSVQAANSYLLDADLSLPTRPSAMRKAHSVRSSMIEHRKVGFGDLIIREFSVVPGNNVCSKGCPMSIGHEIDHSVLPLDDYENQKFTRKSGESLRLSRKDRMEWLLESGYTMGEIVQEIRESDNLRHQRFASVLHRKMDRVDYAMERAGRTFRKVKNVLTLSPKSGTVALPLPRTSGGAGSSNHGKAVPTPEQLDKLVVPDCTSLSSSEED